MSAALADLSARVAGCRRCPRLVEWRERVAREKRTAFASEEYWGRPVPGFGDPGAWLLIVGLAPAAHGANRTGRMFTGDRSGDWLYGALHRAGFASQDTSTSRDDGLKLTGAYVTAAVRCAPPDNKPLTPERDACRTFLDSELDLLSKLRVIVALGGFAYSVVLRLLRDRGEAVPRPLPRFAHCVEVRIRHDLGVLGAYHPSQQNTFTGRLTREMFDAVWSRALVLPFREGAGPQSQYPRGLKEH